MAKLSKSLKKATEEVVSALKERLPYWGVKIEEASCDACQSNIVIVEFAIPILDKILFIALSEQAKDLIYVVAYYTESGKEVYLTQVSLPPKFLYEKTHAILDGFIYALSDAEIPEGFRKILNRRPSYKGRKRTR